MEVVDIAFVGSGIATTVTMMELLDKILKDTSHSEKHTIAIIEKNKELWVGVPYGVRSSVNALTITHVKDFVYEPERPAFFKWLLENKNKWASYYRENGGVTAARWLENNLPLIDREDWETVYIPRFIFGMYILEKLNVLLKAAQEKGLIALTIIEAEAIDVKIIDDGLHEVILEHPDNKLSNIVSRKLVISIGSPPVKKMYDNSNNEIVYVNDIYDPSVNDNIAAIQTALNHVEDPADRNVLVIGSNASSIELLYLLEGMSDVRKTINKTVVISPSGIFPYPISTEVFDSYPTPHLDQLKEAGNYTLPVLMEGTSADLKLALQNGANVAYIAAIINNTLALLQELGEEAKKEFIGIYGMRLSRIFRRSGPEYKQGSQLLLDLKEAELLNGKFVKATPSGNGVVLTYINTDTDLEETYPLNFKAIINCSGSDNLDVSTSRLIYNLVHKHHCKVNLSGKGFEVNEKFETAPNLYIMGPLLGGNMNSLIHFWHLENAPRLMYLAPYLADVLLND